jgi:hypothetical protein
MYDNAFGKISAATDKLLEENKLDATKPSEVISVMAGLCGYRPKEPAKASPSGSR